MISNELPVLRRELKKYSIKDIWNADEFGIFNQMPPRNTIAPATISARKKEDITCLPSYNADGSEKIPILFIGKSKNPRCFNEKSSSEFNI